MFNCVILSSKKQTNLPIVKIMFIVQSVHWGKTQSVADKPIHVYMKRCPFEDNEGVTLLFSL